jgi:hypothetical protein
VIAVAILITIFVILVIIVTHRKERIMVLEEVIPEGRIVSHEDGVVEYRSVYFILGNHDLYKRKKLLERISYNEMQGPCIVDLRFNSQIIIKKGPVDDRIWLGPGKLE